MHYSILLNFLLIYPRPIFSIGWFFSLLGILTTLKLKRNQNLKLFLNWKCRACFAWSSSGSRLGELFFLFWPEANPLSHSSVGSES